jgi:hypothetical protein
MWFWRRMEKISWTDRVRNGKVIHIVKMERNIIHTIKRRKDNSIGHILCRNCLVKHIVEGNIEGGIEGTEGQGRRRKRLLGCVNETRECWKLKEEALDRTVWELALERTMDLL